MAGDLGHSSNRRREVTGSRHVLVACGILLIASVSLNIALLHQQPIPAKAERGASEEIACAKTCPSTNCSEVCARAHVNAQIRKRRMEAFPEAKDVQVSGTKAKPLEDTLIFVGIISGRGYRFVLLPIFPCSEERSMIASISPSRILQS